MTHLERSDFRQPRKALTFDGEKAPDGRIGRIRLGRLHVEPAEMGLASGWSDSALQFAGRCILRGKSHFSPNHAQPRNRENLEPPHFPLSNFNSVHHSVSHNSETMKKKRNRENNPIFYTLEGIKPNTIPQSSIDTVLSNLILKY